VSLSRATFSGALVKFAKSGFRPDSVSVPAGTQAPLSVKLQSSPSFCAHEVDSMVLLSNASYGNQPMGPAIPLDSIQKIVITDYAIYPTPIVCFLSCKTNRDQLNVCHCPLDSVPLIIACKSAAGKMPRQRDCRRIISGSPAPDA
jgi:hypothetical protein